MYREIHTERLLLRPLDISDLEIVHSYSSDPENTLYMYSLPSDTIEETAEFLTDCTAQWNKENPDYYEFAIVYDARVIGSVSVYPKEDGKEGMLGWIIDKEYWGRGIAAEAAAAARDFALNELGLEILTAYCDVKNIASYKVMKKIGMTLESSDGTRTYKKGKGTSGELKYSMKNKKEE